MLIAIAVRLFANCYTLVTYLLTYNTLSVPDMHIQQILILVHKFMYFNHKLPSILSYSFGVDSSIHEHHTRVNNDLHISSITENYGK